jgi:hypothetical protein
LEDGAALALTEKSKMDYTPSPQAVQVISQLIEFESGWYSGAHISYVLAPDSYEDRGFVKKVLSDLHRVGVLERLYATHADRPLPIYKIEPARLEAFVSEAER